MCHWLQVKFRRRMGQSGPLSVFAPPLYDTQIGLRGEVAHRVARLALLMGHTEMIQTTENHLKRDLLQGQAQFFGHCIAEVDEHAVEQPGCPYLQLDAIASSRPKIGQPFPPSPGERGKGQPQETLDQQKGLLDAPALPIKVDHIGCARDVRVQYISQSKKGKAKKPKSNISRVPLWSMAFIRSSSRKLLSLAQRFSSSHSWMGKWY